MKGDTDIAITLFCLVAASYWQSATLFVHFSKSYHCAVKGSYYQRH